ncbi:hypothetical protein LGM46_29675 [Burkholderia arboris]|uniref:hypothetical protein n=1 Tax=Burkholderia arboris TaxID=488730 RepID=UPI001CF1AB06|nr:hypothetical protein [Burkholderia arboris]MCA8037141.1 hypothetical protein [Burkholderia arboris]
MKFNRLALAAVLALSAATSFAATDAQVKGYEREVKKQALKDCSGDPGDGISTTAYSGKLNSVGRVTVIVAGSSGCGGGARLVTWLRVYLPSGQSIKPDLNATPWMIEKVRFAGNEIVVESQELADGDAPNFPSDVVEWKYSIRNDKLDLESRRILPKDDGPD